MSDRALLYRSLSVVGAMLEVGRELERHAPGLRDGARVLHNDLLTQLASPSAAAAAQALDSDQREFDDLRQLRVDLADALSGAPGSNVSAAARALRERMVLAVEARYASKPFDPLPPAKGAPIAEQKITPDAPAKKVPDPGGPFRVFVDGATAGGDRLTFDDRNDAVAWAKGCGFNPFEVRRADGSVCDVVVVAKKQRKPRAKPAEEKKADDATTPVEQAIADAGGAS